MAALSIIPIIGKVLDRVLPDKAQNDAAKQELANIALTGELAEVTGQLDIDKAEAASENWFTSGWRPGVGWVCVLGLFSQFIGRPFVIFLCGLFHRQDIAASYPTLDLSTLMTLVFAMLGIGVHEKLTS